MENPNCPDAQYPEFNPATGECFNTATIERVYQDHINNTPPIASRTVVLLLLGAVIGFAISRKTR
jgi:hypothetical protein